MTFSAGLLILVLVEGWLLYLPFTLKKEKIMSDNLVSRRNFLKKTAMLSAGLAAAGGLAACQPKVAGETATTGETIFDKEVDVVVVGSGTVIFAALAAKDAGAESVLVLEKNVAFGGTSAISGGGFWIPMNYRMAEEGIEDNREDAYKYLKAVSDGYSDDVLINAYLDNAPKMVEWSRDKLGLKWYNNQEAQGNKNYQDYYELPGFRPFGRTIYFSKGEDPYTYGMPWQILRASAEELGIEILTETAAKDLITNAAGEVIGVKAESASGAMNIKAKKGVILGTGGFDYNKDMTTAFLRTPIFASNAVTTNTGDGHKMGMKLGADLRNMQSYWGLPFYVPEEGSMMGEGDWQTYRGKPGSIVVNKHGERIGNESAAYHVFNRSFSAWDSGAFEWRNIPAFWIADSLFAQSWFFPGSNYTPGVVPEWIVQADTLEELCQKLGIDADGLNATLAVFNPNAAEGKDPVYHRGEYQFDLNTSTNPYLTDLKNGCLAPIAVGPFFGCKYYPGTCGTNGGLHINENAQVLKVDGTPIPRLYACGNTSGSVMGAAYPGGGSCLGSGGTFAYLAGKHVVGLESL
jgi:succinate dehydrogenase/fumarate reductase flavoprotein subunit